MPQGPGESALCADLRSKRYFFLDHAPVVPADLVDGSNDCWCERTMQKLGPDSDVVHPEDCTSARSCFRQVVRS